MEAEELERGAVSYQVYLYLIKSMGWPSIVIYLIFRVLQEVANIARPLWLAEWTDASIPLNATFNAVSDIKKRSVQWRQRKGKEEEHSSPEIFLVTPNYFPQT